MCLYIYIYIYQNTVTKWVFITKIFKHLLQWFCFYYFRPIRGTILLHM